MTERLFFAVPAPVEVVNVVQKLENMNSDLTGTRWVRSGNLHMTIFFIGDVDSSNREFIVTTGLQIIESLVPFSLIFEKISFEGGRRNRPSMLWARYERCNEFTSLNHRFQNALENIIPSASKFHNPIPHITLARIRSGKLPLVDSSYKLSTDISEFGLWKSNKTINGVEYEIVKKFSK